MEIKFGKGTTEYGPGVEIKMTGEDVAIAIDAYLVAHGIYVNGPRTIRVNDEPCEKGSVYVDPTGSVQSDGIRWTGRGEKIE